MNYFKQILNDTVFWAEYGHSGQPLPGVHFDLDDLPFQTDHSAGVYACQHVTSLDWEVKIVNGRGKKLSAQVNIDSCRLLNRQGHSRSNPLGSRISS